MKRVSAELLEFDKSFIADQMMLMNGGYATNKKGMQIAKELVNEIIDQELTPRQQQVIRMKFFKGKRASRIAEELNLDKSTVSRTITRGKATIERYMKYCMKYLCTVSDDDD